MQRFVHGALYLQSLAAGVLPASKLQTIFYKACNLERVEQYDTAQAVTGKMRTLKIGSAVQWAASASPKPTRLFSTSTFRQATWGFVGLGAMGKLANECLSLL